MTESLHTPPDPHAPVSLAFVNNFAGPTLGGGEIQLLTLLAGLPPHAFSVTLVCAQGSALAEMGAMFDGVRVATVDFDSASVGDMAAAIAERTEGADIVQGTGFLTNVLVRNAGARVGARVVNTVHVVPGAAKLDGESWMRGLVRRLLDRSHRDRVDRFVAVSEAVARELAARGTPADRITVIPNGVDVGRLEARSRSDLGDAVPAGSPLVGYLGRLERVKGTEEFLRAAAKLAERYPDAAFVVAGEGSLREESEKLVGVLGIAERVTFAGHVPDPAPWLAAMDVVVVPSLSEAFGLTAIEAMALEVPVVASDVGGLSEVVSDGETGLLVAAGDTKGIAAAVSRLVDDAELAQRLVRAAKMRVEERYRADRMVAEYLALYRRLLAG